MKNIVVFGGGGYCASLLIPQLLDEGWNVRAFDTFWYGIDHFPKSSKLSLIKGDVRDLNAVKEALKDFDHVLHLACISNDASF